MSKVTFYTHISNPLHFACQLVQKAYAQQARMLVWVANESELTKIDALLWSFEPASFIPHQLWSVDEPQPDRQQGVLLATAPNLPWVAAETVVLNLADTYWYDAPQRPQRILELIGQDAASLAAARQRFRAYQAAGFNLEHHDMSRHD